MWNVKYLLQLHVMDRNKLLTKDTGLSGRSLLFFAGVSLKLQPQTNRDGESIDFCNTSPRKTLQNSCLICSIIHLTASVNEGFSLREGYNYETNWCNNNRFVFGVDF